MTKRAAASLDAGASCRRMPVQLATRTAIVLHYLSWPQPQLDQYGIKRKGGMAFAENKSIAVRVTQVAIRKPH